MCLTAVTEREVNEYCFNARVVLESTVALIRNDRNLIVLHMFHSPNRLQMIDNAVLCGIFFAMHVMRHSIVTGQKA